MTRIYPKIIDFTKKTILQQIIGIGEPLWCAIKTIMTSREASVITVSTLSDDVNSCVETDRSSVNEVIPGMCVHFRAEKSLKDGLEGTIFIDCIAYVNEVYLTEPLTSLERYVGETTEAFVLYVQPTTNFTYLTLRTLKTAAPPKLPIGQILPAQVLSRIGKGIALKLTKNEKGFIAYRRVLNTLKLSDSCDLEDMVHIKYPAGTTHTCRILDYVYMDKLYICTFEQSVLEEKIFTLSDLKIGELVKATVLEINRSGILVKLGNLRGFVNNEHISNVHYSETLKGKFKVGQIVTGRVWINKGLTNIKLTLKQAFIESDICLTDYDRAEVNTQYPGMVVKITDRGALIKFYNDVQGWLKQNSDAPHNSLRKLLYEGQVISVWIVNKEGTRLTLSQESPEKVTDDYEQSYDNYEDESCPQLKLGDVFDGEVTCILNDGMYVVVGPHHLRGFVPVTHLCSSPELGSVILNFYRVGDRLRDLICISNTDAKILSLCEHRFFSEEEHVIPDDINTGDVIRCYVKNAKKKTWRLTSPAQKFNGEVVVPKKHLMKRFDTTDEEFELLKYQPILAKVKAVRSRNYVIATMKLSAIYEFNPDYSARRLERYLDDIAYIREILIRHEDPLAYIKVGERILCKVKELDDQRCCVDLPNGINGFVNIRNCPKKLKRGSEHTGVILWVDFIHRHVILTLKPETITEINSTQDGSINGSADKLIPCELLMIHKDFVQCLLKSQGRGQLAFIPTYLHENDFFPDYSYYEELTKNIKFKIKLLRYGKIIGFEQKFLKKFHNRDATKKCGEDLKVTENGFHVVRISDETVESDRGEDVLDSNNEIDDCESEIDDSSGDEEVIEEEDGDGKIAINNIAHETESSEEENMVASEQEKEPKQTCKRKNANDRVLVSKKRPRVEKVPSIDTPRPILSGVESFFDSDEDKAVIQSSEDEKVQDESGIKSCKKKKLTGSEQAELLKQREEYLRKKEDEFADPTAIPLNAEQFDRRLLGEPNSSELWAQYIAFHIQSTEIDKARAVIQRALKTIQQTAQQERLNIWIIYLNLESMYGSKETFDTVFDEAVRCNDALTIYLEAIKILAESSNSDDVDEKIKKARAKFKQEAKMYVEIGKVYYKQKRLVDARKLKDSALRTVVDKKKHVPLIVQFAILEINEGEENHGEALFETIIQSDPRRTDVWSAYIDQLVKRNKIDLARKVLERAVAQKLNYKKMKILYKKFQDFEQKHGTNGTRDHVKKLLEDYVSQFVDK